MLESRAQRTNRATNRQTGRARTRKRDKHVIIEIETKRENVYNFNRFN